jgi:hypothetical protein
MANDDLQGIFREWRYDPLERGRGPGENPYEIARRARKSTRRAGKRPNFAESSWMEWGSLRANLPCVYDVLDLGNHLIRRLWVAK